MSDIQGTIILAENAAGNGFKRLKLDASGRLECSVNEIEITAAAITVAVDGLEGLQTQTNTKLDTLEASLTSMEGKQDTQIGHMDGVEASLTAITGYVDGLETLQTAANTDLAAIEVLLTSANTDHAANEALLTTIDADTNDIKTNTASCATDLAALEVLQTSTNSKLDHLSDNQDTLETTLTAIETDTAAIEVLLTAANTDHAANEALLTTIDADTNDIKTNTAAMVVDLAAIEVINNNAEVHLGNIDTGVDVLEACVGSNKVNVNISSGNISGFSTASNQSTIIGHLDGVEGKLDTLETTLTAIETDQAAIEVLHTATNQKLDDIETAVQLIDDAIKTEDLAHSSGDKGIPCLMVRQDSHSDLAADGDYMIPTINANGEIRVTSTAASGGATESKQDAMITDLAAIEVLLTQANSNQGTLDTSISDTTNAIDTMDAVLDQCLVKQSAMVVDLAALEVLQTTTNSKIDTFDAVLDASLVKQTEIDSVLDTIKVDTEAIETAVEKLSGVSEAVWLNNATVNAQALSASLDTTGYTKVRLYGVVDQSFFSGTSDLILMGSLTDGGVYFNLGANVTNEVGASNGASVQTLNCLLESPPKFIKIKNDAGADNYAMTINAKMTHT